MEVHARKWEGPGTIAVYHNVKGDQSAKKGDWLVGPDNAEHGEIEVIKAADFERDYEPIDAAWPEPGPIGGETHEGVPVAHLGNAEGELPTTDEPVIDDSDTPVADQE